MRKTELLIPAGSLDVLKTAVIYGADAVYIGGEAFGLRAKAHNFSLEDMKEGIAFAHAHDVKVYVTANILAHNQDLPGVEAYFEELKEIVKDYTPEKVAEICHIDADDLRKAAIMYAKADRAPIIYCLGVTEHSTGTEGVMSMSNMALLVGKLGREINMNVFQNIETYF